jgi:HK97 family phage portal protein
MRLNLGKLSGLRDIVMDAVRAMRPKASAGGLMSGFELLTYGSLFGEDSVGSPYVALQCAPVYAVIKVISESFAQIDCHLHARDERGGAMGRELDHPVSDLLRGDPNPEMTMFEFRQYSQSMVSLFGNAFAWIVRDYRGEPAELWPLRPEQVAIIYDPRFPLKPLYTVTGPDGQSYELHRRDILHVRTLGSLPYRGDSPVMLNWRTISNWLVMEAHLSRLFGQGAKPAGVLKTQKVLSPEATGMLRQQFDATYGGSNSARTVVLQEGMEWQQMSLNSVDSQFQELRKEQLWNVCRIWRVPPLLLQDPEKSIGSTAETLGRWFLSYTLAPLLDAWEKALSISFLTSEERRRYYLQHDVTEFTRAESQTRWQAYVAAVTNGIYSVNEVRNMEGFAPIDGGDVYRQPANTMPATNQYIGQTSHVTNPTQTLLAPLQAPQPGRALELRSYRAQEARMIEARRQLEHALTRPPGSLRPAPPRARAQPRAEPWIEIAETPKENGNA